MLGLDRSIRPQDSPILGSDSKLDGSNIYLRSPEDLNHLGLKDDTPTSTVEIVGGALEDVDVKSDLAQQIAREQPPSEPPMIKARRVRDRFAFAIAANTSLSWGNRAG